MHIYSNILEIYILSSLFPKYFMKMEWILLMTIFHIFRNSYIIFLHRSNCTIKDISKHSWVIPALKRQKQGNCTKLMASLVYTVRIYLKEIFNSFLIWNLGHKLSQ